MFFYNSLSNNFNGARDLYQQIKIAHKIYLLCCLMDSQSNQTEVSISQYFILLSPAFVHLYFQSCNLKSNQTWNCQRIQLEFPLRSIENVNFVEKPKIDLRTFENCMNFGTTANYPSEFCIQLDIWQMFGMKPIRLYLTKKKLGSAFSKEWHSNDFKIN